ncbi:protein LONGIFOLIA 1 [Quillaja saponaria]|uniref:Protein LONGIFOLIA 1 n=1 Tax=Quillaja saponaria TaxID=32244 RepID=A0AAD7QAE9_QUISA|nr:protein LONGIFOLIA 1 [Quillaja saponaria]
MKTGIVQDQNVEKQMGCMAGFLQIFDRHQILTGKRIYSTKRLPPSVAVNSTLEPEKLSESTEISRELEKQPPKSTPSPDRSKQHKPIDPMSALPETTTPSKTPLPLSVFEFKQGTRSSWKFSKEAPRLSLDSRAIVDAEGSLHPREIRTNRAILSTNRCENSGEEPECDSDKQRRSPSVIARLMGLEQLPSSEPESVKKVELRRSASESRASRDLFHYRFFDSNNFQLKQMQQEPHCQSNMIRGNAAAIENRICNGRPVDPKEFTIRNVKAEPAKAHQRGMGQKKSFYDSADFFPEAKQTVSIYGEIEKRLKMRGIDEPSKDLETLKQILEALQLKGLLHHSKKPISQTNMSNFVHDRRSYTLDESPIVVMKPARSPVLTNRTGMTGGDSHPSSFRSRPRARRNLNISNETLPTASPRRGQTEILDRNVRNQTRGRTASSPTRIESSVKSPNRRRATNIETQRKRNDSDDQRRISPVQSPKIGSRRIISEQQVTNRSPRMRKPTVEIYQTDEKVFVPAGDESSTISEISISTCSQTDTERSKVEDYKEGRNLLERCDKLLHSIAEITTTELQPSPVSVLDSLFYESSSPSPVMKRSIDYEV